MERLGLYVLCVLLLTTCAQGKTVQQLGDDPPCGTPVECYAEAIEALKQAEQRIESLNNAILTLNKTLKQVVANQTEIKANQLQLKANQSRMMTNQTQMKADICVNSQSISANKEAINTNSKAISSNKQTVSDLTPYACNCDNSGTASSCGGTEISQGFDYVCEKTSCSNSWVPVVATDHNVGMRCCDICLGSSEEAKAYALAHPRPQTVAVECNENDNEPPRKLL